MGQSIQQEEYNDADFQRFALKLQDNLQALDLLLKRPGFGQGEATLGAEVELYLIDDDGYPLAINREVAKSCSELNLQVELNRFNIEMNLMPTCLKGKPFSQFISEYDQGMSRLQKAAEGLGGQTVAIGILPTLRQQDLAADLMTDEPRYRVLRDRLRSLRGAPFRIEINGREAISIETEDITLEGANTSHQIHWRVPPERFVDSFNAVQLATPLALALAANSPSLLQKQLWQETRIALFQMSVDARSKDDIHWRAPGRVNFGQGWLRNSPWEAFAEYVALYPTLIPTCGPENPLKSVNAGRIPELSELRLHGGTVWPWNRAIYDPNSGGQLRIEMRALPSGPGSLDMAANTAFMLGAAAYLRKNISHLLPGLPFKHAKYNFYRAAQKGLDAHLVWPSVSQNQLRETPVIDILNQVMPYIGESLAELGVADDEIDRALPVLQGRIDNRINGAQWQVHTLNGLLKHTDKTSAYAEMLKRYVYHQRSGLPVCDWPLAPD